MTLTGIISIPGQIDSQVLQSLGRREMMKTVMVTEHSLRMKSGEDGTQTQTLEQIRFH